MKYKRYPEPLYGILGYDTPTIEHGPPVNPTDIPLMDLCEMARSDSLPKSKAQTFPVKPGVRIGLGSYLPGDD